MLTDEFRNFFEVHTEPVLLDDIDTTASDSNLFYLLGKLKVRIIAPIVHNDKVYGIICVGEKFSKKDYTS